MDQLRYIIYKIKQGICKVFGHKLDDGPADWSLGDDFEYWDCQRCGGLCADKWEETVHRDLVRRIRDQ